MVLLGLLLVSAVGLLLLRVQGEQLLSVQTGSMEPVLYPGDAVIVEPLNRRSLEPDIIVSYRSPRAPGLIITHRLVAIDPHSGWLTTEGDALESPDPEFSPRLVIGRVAAVAPRLGAVTDALRHPLVLAFALYIPAATVVVTEIKRLATANSRRHYRLRGS
jgi:signal peptidase I